MKNIEKILKEHMKWLKTNGEDGRKANLSGADLSGADLSGADLKWADLSKADLSGADLSGADLKWANLSGVNLSRADLRGVDLRGADLREADLRGVNLSRADLENVNNLFYPLNCPEKGSFIGYKKAGEYIVELHIEEDALRSSATSRKCRCSKAKVISITNIDGTRADVTTACSDHDNTFKYEVGSIVTVDDFDTNRWNECAPGIHFFITREEAVRYV